MRKTIDFASELNQEQHDAAMAPDGPLLVLAAAGTGKTRTLVYRVAFLVEKGVAPERILLLTFTNRAAREMLGRARELVGHRIGGLWGGTFHHMANRMLRRYGRLVGLEPDFTILDRDDARTLVANCVKEHKLNSKEFPKKDVLLSLFSSAANTNRPLCDVIADRFGEITVDVADIQRIHDSYVDKKRALGATDFDDMLTKALDLLRNSADVRERYQEQFLHVLVDEYQDTNCIQAELVDTIAARHRNVLVVGDDFQSIYSWRGADFRNIMTFPERYADAQMHKLETNYRSVPEILHVANKVIAGNPEQFQKTLRPTRESYRKPAVAELRDGNDQARYVVDQVRKLCRDGYRLRDIAVLYRAHFHAMELQIALTQAHIPHVITSGVRFFEQAHIKDVCSLVRIMENPGDELAFQRLLCLFRGVGPATVARIWKKLGGRFDAAHAGQRELVGNTLKKQAGQSWESIVPVMADYAQRRTGRDGAEILTRFVEAFYLEHAYNTFDNAERRVDDVQELILHASEYETLSRFLNDIALLTNIDAELDYAASQDNDAMHLSTVHQAKGLEWPVVIIIWAADGMFPSSRSVSDSPEGAAEERRLFYVAVTRAKDELHICVPRLRRTRDGGVFPVQPSPFVQELPPELVRHKGSRY